MLLARCGRPVLGVDKDSLEPCPAAGGENPALPSHASLRNTIAAVSKAEAKNAETQAHLHANLSIMFPERPTAFDPDFASENLRDGHASLLSHFFIQQRIVILSKAKDPLLPSSQIEKICHPERSEGPASALLSNREDLSS